MAQLTNISGSIAMPPLRGGFSDNGMVLPPMQNRGLPPGNYRSDISLQVKSDKRQNPL